MDEQGEFEFGKDQPWEKVSDKHECASESDLEMIDGSEEVKGEKGLVKKKRVKTEEVVEELGCAGTHAEQKKDELLGGAWGKEEEGRQDFVVEGGLLWRMAKDRL